MKSKRTAFRIVLLSLVVIMTGACCPNKNPESELNTTPVASVASCTPEAGTGGAERMRLFSETASGTSENVAEATKSLNKQVNLWLTCNPTVKVVSIDHKETSTGNLPEDGFAYNTVFITITILVRYTS